jgi:hypothetical protein
LRTSPLRTWPKPRSSSISAPLGSRSTRTRAHRPSKVVRMTGDETEAPCATSTSQSLSSASSAPLTIVEGLPERSARLARATSVGPRRSASSTAKLCGSGAPAPSRATAGSSTEASPERGLRATISQARESNTSQPESSCRTSRARSAPAPCIRKRSGSASSSRPRGSAPPPRRSPSLLHEGGRSQPPSTSTRSRPVPVLGSSVRPCTGAAAAFARRTKSRRVPRGSPTPTVEERHSTLPSGRKVFSASACSVTGTLCQTRGPACSTRPPERALGLPGCALGIGVVSLATLA